MPSKVRTNTEDREKSVNSGGRGGSISATVAFKILPLLKKAKGISQPWNPGEALFHFNDTSQGL